MHEKFDSFGNKISVNKKNIQISPYQDSLNSEKYQNSSYDKDSMRYQNRPKDWNFTEKVKLHDVDLKDNSEKSGLKRQNGAASYPGEKLILGTKPMLSYTI